MCAEIDNTAALIDDMSNTYLTFMLNEQFYAIPINEVLQIVNMPSITAMPAAPDFVNGVTTVNGEVTIAVSLKTALGIQNTVAESERCMVVTYIKGTRIGFMVDTVCDVEEIEKELISDPPKITDTENKSYLSGIANTSKGIVLIADIKNIMDDECIAACKAANEKQQKELQADKEADNTDTENENALPEKENGEAAEEESV